MNYRVVKYFNSYFIVLGIGYDPSLEIPDYFECVPLDYSFITSVLTNLATIKLPISLVEEITDKRTIMALWVLYGH